MTKLLTRTAVPILIIALALTVTACGQDTGETTTTATTESEFGFGTPADADRVVEIQTTDALAFEPADFTLGDQATQDEHETEMSEMDGMTHDEPNVTIVPAGETVEITWTFAARAPSSSAVTNPDTMTRA